MQFAGEDSVGDDALAYGILHYLPHLCEVFPQAFAFVHFDILPECESVFLDVLKDIGHFGVGVYHCFGGIGGTIGQVAASDAVDC